ncbi:MAG TPA: hypothetical protein VFC58_11400 [Desulfosporosinus sp.]|nr:hypothetical protein [Desulfosporosinus sp.]
MLPIFIPDQLFYSLEPALVLIALLLNRQYPHFLCNLSWVNGMDFFGLLKLCSDVILAVPSYKSQQNTKQKYMWIYWFLGLTTMEIQS